MFLRQKMKNIHLDHLTAQLTHELSQTYGLLVDTKTKNRVSAILKNYSNEIKLLSYSQLCQFIMNKISVNETYFFRDQLLTKFFIKYLYDFQKSEKKELTIWSMGSSSGEEAYTLAILLDDYGILGDGNYRIRILGFDINTDVLKQAELACFQASSFRATSEYYISKYFKSAQENYILSPGIKESVMFFHFNLAKDLFNNQKMNELIFEHGRPDIIICRNILIYLKKRLSMKIVSVFSQILSFNSYFITSPQEAFLYQKSNFYPMNQDNYFILKKNNKEKVDDFQKKQNKIQKLSKEINLDNKDDLKLYKNFVDEKAILVKKNSQNIIHDRNDQNLLDSSSIQKASLHEAVLKIQQEEYDLAHALLYKITQKDPFCYCAYLLRAYAFQRSLMWSKSIEFIRKSRFIKQGSVFEYHLLGQYFQAQSKLEQYYESQKNALTLYQDSQISPLEFQLLEWLGIGVSELLMASMNNKRTE